MGDAKLDLLKAIMDAYPFEGGGNCIKAAVFHSHMLNTFKPAFDRLTIQTDVVNPADVTFVHVNTGDNPQLDAEIQQFMKDVPNMVSPRHSEEE